MGKKSNEKKMRTSNNGEEKTKKVPNQNIFLALLKAQNETEVDITLSKLEGCDNEIGWGLINGKKSNFASVTNQQRTPEHSLIEKVFNSYDALLFREFLKGRYKSNDKFINTLEKARDYFFPDFAGGVHRSEKMAKEFDELNMFIDGDFSRIPGTKRKNIVNIAIFDKGEGQHKEDFIHTFLKTEGSNKVKYPFLSGRFCMGGNGVIPFCGTRNYVLLCSRRCEGIKSPDYENGGEGWKEYKNGSPDFGFTLIRKHTRTPEERQESKDTWFEYMTDKDGNILTFSKDDVGGYVELMTNVDPDESKQYSVPFEWGTFQKFYNYKLNWKTAAYRTFFYRRLPDILGNRITDVLPIQIYDNRERKVILKESKEEESRQTTFYGKLHDINVLGQKFVRKLKNDMPLGVQDVSIIWKKIKVPTKCYFPMFSKKDKPIADNDYVVSFHFNGQVLIGYTKSTFKQLFPDFKEIADCIQIVVDCGILADVAFDEIFMSNKDTFRAESDFPETVHRAIKDNALLKEFAKEKESDLLKGLITSNSKDLNTAMLKLLQLSEIDYSKIEEQNVSKNISRRRLNSNGELVEIIPRDYPSYLKVDLSTDETHYGIVHFDEEHKTSTMVLHTDARSDFFSKKFGDYVISFNGKLKGKITETSISINNGVLYVNMALLETVEEQIYEGNSFTISKEPDSSGRRVFHKSITFDVEFTRDPVKIRRHKDEIIRTEKMIDSETGKDKITKEVIDLPQISYLNTMEWETKNLDKEKIVHILIKDERINHIIIHTTHPIFNRINVVFRKISIDSLVLYLISLHKHISDSFKEIRSNNELTDEEQQKIFLPDIDRELERYALAIMNAFISFQTAPDLKKPKKETKSESNLFDDNGRLVIESLPVEEVLMN